MTRITPDPRVRFGCMASWVRCRFVRKRGFENRDVALEDASPFSTVASVGRPTTPWKSGWGDVTRP